MEWWDDLWLNEGFASLLMYFAMDAIYPEWNVVCCKAHCLSVKKWLSSRTVVSSIFINIEYQFLWFSLLFIHKIKCSSKWNFTYVLYFAMTLLILETVIFTTKSTKIEALEYKWKQVFLLLITIWQNGGSCNQGVNLIFNDTYAEKNNFLAVVSTISTHC